MIYDIVKGFDKESKGQNSVFFIYIYKIKLDKKLKR